MRLASLALALGTFALAPLQAQAQADLHRYRVDIVKGVDAHPQFIYGLDLNDLGEVTGSARFGDPRDNRYGSAFVWRHGELQALGPFTGETSRGVAINNRGEVAGYYVSRDSHAAVPLLYRDGHMIDLSTALPLDPTGMAVGVNEAGQVVGNLDGSGRSFLYSDGRSRYLPRDADTHYYEVSGLNDRGDVIGNVWNDCCTYQGFVLRDGQLQRLPSFGGEYSEANAINNAGLVVGSAWTRDMSTYLPVVYEADAIRSLQTPGGDLGVAQDVNDAGWIVGWAQYADLHRSAFLWADGGMHDLNDLLAGGAGMKLHVRDAVAINEAGQILAYSEFNGPGHYNRTVLLTPVPEASSWAMALAGLGLVGWTTRRRRQGARA